MTIQKLKFLATTGLLLSLTSIGHAMDAEKDRSLYTKVMKHISKPEVELNLES